MVNTRRRYPVFAKTLYYLPLIRNHILTAASAMESLLLDIQAFTFYFPALSLPPPLSPSPISPP